MINKKLIIKYSSLIAFSFFIFFSNIGLNAKVLFFWGGNQYDVRYFYPYTLCLAFPLILVIKQIISAKKRFLKIYFLIIFGMASLWSLLMGWLGVINMYKPALTGERRIWMDIYDLPSQFFNHSFREYLDATFMNRENFWIPIFFSFLIYLIYVVYKLKFFRLILKIKSISLKLKKLPRFFL